METYPGDEPELAEEDLVESGSETEESLDAQVEKIMKALREDERRDARARAGQGTLYHPISGFIPPIFRPGPGRHHD